MKKLFTVLAFVSLFAMVSESNAQLYKKSWAFGFGASYPRWTSTTMHHGQVNYGIFLSMKRTYSEHFAARFALKYSHLIALWGANQETATNFVSGDLDVMYSLVPCEPVSPYVFMGLGGFYAMIDNPQDVKIGDNVIDYQFNMGVGAEWKVGEKWKLVTELGMHTTGDSKPDGAYRTSGGGILGTYTDTYMNIDLGFLYYFGQKDESKLCQIYEGIKLEEMPDPVDYEKIENIVRKYIPREVVKEVVVEKPVEGSARRWVLVGVNFDFNSSKLKEEAYPVLFHAVQVLLLNPDMNVEIQGYTDNIGTKQVNQKLSMKRAETVKNYLVARGVAASRLTTVGFGEDNPIADNKTAAGRSANRRIEFKVK